MARKLLMIDDDKVLMDVVGKFMTLKGWTFEGMRVPDKVLEKAKSFHPDAILLDVQLPGRDGWDICRELKGDETLKHIPIVMVSGRRMSPEEKAKGIEIGADDYLSKPFDLASLLAKTETILRVAES